MAKILLVDDDPLLIRMYQTKFQNDGHIVEVASDGDEALKKAADFAPNLILLDIMMPKVDGLEVLERLKKDETTKSIPVVILTNVGGSNDDIQRGLELGAVAYLVKADYTPAEVVSKVKEILAGYTHDLPKVKVHIKDISS